MIISYYYLLSSLLSYHIYIYTYIHPQSSHSINTPSRQMAGFPDFPLNPYRSTATAAKNVLAEPPQPSKAAGSLRCVHLLKCLRLGKIIQRIIILLALRIQSPKLRMVMSHFLYKIPNRNEGLQGFPTKNGIILVVTVSGVGVDTIV